MSGIIALVDGSDYSRSVCGLSAWIAMRAGLGVELLHVLGRRHPTASMDLSGSIALGARSTLLEELSELDERTARLAQTKGRAILEDAETILREAGVQNVSTRLRIGDLTEEAERGPEPPELIVMGKRGEAADFAKGHLGSNLERVARTAKAPLFVAARAHKPVERFLIAYDGGASSMKALDYVSRSRIFAGLACRVVTIGPPGAETERRLSDAMAMLEGAGFEAEGAALTGAPDRVIAEQVDHGGADLLVMGAYGHSKLRSMIIGSTTTSMVRQCRIPVALFR